MKFKCIFSGHDWITGRVADSDARRMVPDQKSYHNRACRRCGKAEWHADETEKRADELARARLALRKGKRRDKPCDPNEFP
jgi:hypothetical protein